MPIYRPRVRMLMIAVAVIAVAMVAAMQAMRVSALARRYELLARGHDAGEFDHRLAIRMLDSPPSPPIRDDSSDRGTPAQWMNRLATTPGSKDLLAEPHTPFVQLDIPIRIRTKTPDKPWYERLSRATIERRIEHHAAMRRKYQWMAEHPWFPLAQDPPVPQ